MENTVTGTQQMAMDAHQPEATPVQSVSTAHHIMPSPAEAAPQAIPATGQMMAPPPQAPAPLYPQYLAQQPQTAPLEAPSSPLTEAISAGAMGLVIAGTGALGANLHRVNDGEMGMGEAITDSIGKGAVGAAAAAGATYTASTLTAGGLLGLAVTVAAGTGISYLLNK